MYELRADYILIMPIKEPDVYRTLDVSLHNPLVLWHIGDCSLWLVSFRVVFQGLYLQMRSGLPELLPS